MKRIKPGPKPGEAAAYRREALRFCAAGIDEGWDAERTSELCLELYSVSIPPAVIRDVFETLKKWSESRAIKTPESRIENDLMVS
jgi:hypothetical protein